MSRFASGLCQAKFGGEKPYLLAADFFLFFSDSIALMILDIVRRKEPTSAAISRSLRISRRAVLTALTIMERQGVLTSYVRSGITYYRVVDSRMIETFNRILEFPERKLTHADASRKPSRLRGSKADRPLKAGHLASAR